MVHIPFMEHLIAIFPPQYLVGAPLSLQLLHALVVEGIALFFIWVGTHRWYVERNTIGGLLRILFGLYCWVAITGYALFGDWHAMFLRAFFPSPF